MTMSRVEKRSIGVLSSIVALRMLGLFMLIPIIALYAQDLSGATPIKVGLALGIYGLTQACLQIPFGMVSDKYGRKPIIAFGLVLFACGSITAGLLHSIWGLLLGRALQGAGAVSSVIMALVADVTSEQQRTKAMACIGMSVAVAFIAAFVLAPFMQHWLGVPAIFLSTSVLAFCALLALFMGVPRVTQSTAPVISVRHLTTVLQDSQLWRLDISVGLLHAILAMTFFALPMVLNQHLGFSNTHQAWLYTPALVASFVVIVPGMLFAERYGKKKLLMSIAILLLIVAQMVFYITESPYLLMSAILLFFMGFNLLEAALPSWVSQFAPQNQKGTAMGVYATAQFSGFFLGSIASGLLLQFISLKSVFLLCLLVLMGWSLLVPGLQRQQTVVDTLVSRQ